MIDLHCHLMPGIDDGSTDLEQTLRMAQAAADDGITHTVVTPHVFDGVYRNPLSTLHSSFARLQAALVDADIALQVRLGGEVHLSEHVMELVDKGEAPTIGHWEGRPVMLIEMPHGHVPHGATGLLRWLFAQGLQPMIVHPERNKDIMRKPERVDAFVDMGCLLQVTAGSLHGRFGTTAESVAWRLVERDQVCVVASDAHNTASRPPVLSKARQALSDRMGLTVADLLTRGNAALILGLNADPTAGVASGAGKSGGADANV